MFTSLAHVVPLFQEAFFAHLQFLYQPTFSYPSLCFHLFPPPTPPPPQPPSFLVVYQSMFTYFSPPLLHSFLVVYQSMFTYSLPPPPPAPHQLCGCVLVYVHLFLSPPNPTSFLIVYHSTFTYTRLQLLISPLSVPLRVRLTLPPPLPPRTSVCLLYQSAFIITDKARLMIILRTPKPRQCTKRKKKKKKKEEKKKEKEAIDT